MKEEKNFVFKYLLKIKCIYTSIIEKNYIMYILLISIYYNI